MSVGEVAAMFLAGGLFASWRQYHAVLARRRPRRTHGRPVALARYGLFTVVIAGPISARSCRGDALGLLLWAQVLGLPRASRSRSASASRAGHSGSTPGSSKSRSHSSRRSPGAEGSGSASRGDRHRRASDRTPAVPSPTGPRVGRPPGRHRGPRHRRGRPPPSRRQAERIADHAAAFAPCPALGRDAGSRRRGPATPRDPARRRRGNAVWLGAIGISLLFVGLAQARVVDVPSLGITDGVSGSSQGRSSAQRLPSWVRWSSLSAGASGMAKPAVALGDEFGTREP